MNTTISGGTRCKDASILPTMREVMSSQETRNRLAVSNVPQDVPSSVRSSCKSNAINSTRDGCPVLSMNYSFEEEEIIFAEKLYRRKDFRQKIKKEKQIKIEKDKLKKNIKNEKYHKNSCKIKPHSTSVEGFVCKLKELDINLAAEALETFFVHYFVQMRTSSIEKVLIISAKLVKSLFGVSFSNYIRKILLSDKFTFLKDFQSMTMEGVESYLKSALIDWQTAYKNPIFGSIVVLISTFLAIFYSADKKWSISIGSFTLFLFEARNSCKNVTSLVDAVLKVTSYVVSGLKTFVSSGSLSGFLYADDQLGELDAIVTELQTQFTFIKPGNLLKHAGYDENSFDQKLQNAIKSGERLIPLYDGPTKKLVMDKVRILRQLHCDFIQTKSAGGLRIAPFAYVVAGSTGLGKSSVNEILMRYILQVNGYNHQDPFIVTLNSQDKFFSTYRSYMNGVIFDDFANANSEFSETSPCEILLKFINNVPYYLNMAELELKGNVVAEPKVVGVTTNVCGLDADKYSNQPSSIMRRLKVHIHAKVRPDFKKEGSEELDPAKVHAKFGRDCLAPDIWLFDVFHVVVEAIPRPPKHHPNDSIRHIDDRWYLKFVTWNGSDMKDSSIYELIEYMRQASELHFAEQISLVERSGKHNDDNICSICKHYRGLCSHTAPPVAGSTIHNIQNVLNRMPLGIDEVVESVVTPHSGFADEMRSEVYPRLVESRKEIVEQDLKDMLFSWLVEGKCNFESVYSTFISGCNKEIQHLLIVIRRMAEKWFLANRKFLMEACFPKELEDTRIGDYFSLVVRQKETVLITRTSIVVEALFRLGVLGLSYSYFQAEMAILLSFAGHCVISELDIPDIVARRYMQGMKYVSLSKSLIEGAIGENKFQNLFILALLFFYFGPELNGYTQYLVCAFICFATFQKSIRNISLYKAPRAISRLYKKEKEEYSGELLKIAPATLAITTLYMGSGDVTDFVVEAFERWKLKPQSRLRPTVAEIPSRDKAHRFDADWFRDSVEPFLDPLPVSSVRTPGEVRQAISENVWLVRNNGNNSLSNCLVVCSGCILIPFHYLPKVSTTFTFTRHNKGNKGNRSFVAVVEPEQCVRIKKYDLAMMWMPKTRDVRNLIDCFPTEFHETKTFRTGRIATRDFSGDLEWTDVRGLLFTQCATSGMGYSFPGIRYIWNGAKEGTCLSPVVSDDKKASISGLHIGGSEETMDDGGYLSFGVTPTQGDLLEAKSQLERFSTVIPMSASGTFEVTCMGVDTLQRTIKKKSCYLRMDGENSAYFLGSSMNCNRTPKSQVRDTLIKESVKKIFDITEDWTSPKFKGPDGYSPHHPWEEGMKKWIVDKPGLPFGLLNRAKIDYTNTLTRVLYSAKAYWSSEIRVLTWDETVNGIPGKRFIDSMNFKSSIGFPFKGSKKIFSTNLGQVDDWQDKRILEPRFIEEAEKIESLYKQGKRYYPWFTSTLKDEPTLSTKDKVRVFQATSTPFQLVMRKYTLGICRFLQLNPLDSECAVGIDPCSSEWNEMYTHLRKVQTPLYDRWFAIDYKAYDTSISSQMILAIGRIFTDVARVAGYNNEEIIILQSIFTELSFSVVDFNGDVLMLDGANPSGNSLTVFVNNLCNSLLMRIYFYHIYPRRTFSNNVRMMCYGDDLIAAVNASAGSFTMKGYASYLKQFGFTVTPAQKEEKLKNFSTLQEIDFLKRKFVYSKEYGSMIAPLEELSIYKRLCNYMASETDAEVIIGANIDGALDEWAFYGKETYLDKQEKLIKIVEQFELHRFVHRLYLTFEQRVSLWKQHADPAVMGKGQSMDTELSNCDVDNSGFFGWGRLFPQWK